MRISDASSTLLRMCSLNLTLGLEEPPEWMTLNPDPALYCLPHYWFSKWLRPSDCTSNIFCCFFICENQALLVPMLCLLGTEQGSTRESEGLFLEGKATLTFENNSVERKKHPMHSNMFVRRVGRPSWGDYYCCVLRKIMIRISIVSHNVSSWV